MIRPDTNFLFRDGGVPCFGDTVILLLTPVENHSRHRLARRIYDYLLSPVRFDLYMHRSLQQLCGKVVLYDYLTRQLEIGVGKMNEEIINLVRRERPTFVIWNSMYWYGITEDTFLAVRSEGARVIGWFLDDEVGFENYSKWWIPYIDFFVTNFEEAVLLYERLGAPAAHALAGGMTGMPAAEPSRNEHWFARKTAYDISFVGRQYLDRSAYIEELRKRHLDVHVFGREWPGGEHVPYERLVDIIHSSAINLSFSKVRQGQRQMKGRIFEICVAGGFMLTELTPNIERYFVPGKEIACFDTPDELVERAEYYLKHDEERRAIARAGWQRATASYTSLHIMASVLAKACRVLETKPLLLVRPKRMAVHMRREFSNYYLRWATATLQERHRNHWKDALDLSIHYNPWNFKAWGCQVFRALPTSFWQPLIDCFNFLKKLKRKLV